MFLIREGSRARICQGCSLDETCPLFVRLGIGRRIGLLFAIATRFFYVAVVHVGEGLAGTEILALLFFLSFLLADDCHVLNELCFLPVFKPI